MIRDDLSPIEEAKAYMTRWQLKGQKNLKLISDLKIASALSKELPKSSQAIYNKISLLKLPETIQNAIHLGKLKKEYGCGSNILVGPPVA